MKELVLSLSACLNSYYLINPFFKDTNINYELKCEIVIHANSQGDLGSHADECVFILF